MQWFSASMPPAWFLAAAESLSGKRGLADDLVAPPDPEAVSGAKEWLSASQDAEHHEVSKSD